MILGELYLPYRIEISCDYNATLGLLNTEIELQNDLNLPTNKTNILASGKISVKDKLVKEMEQFKTMSLHRCSMQQSTSVPRGFLYGWKGNVRD